MSAEKVASNRRKRVEALDAQIAALQDERERALLDLEEAEAHIEGDA